MVLRIYTDGSQIKRGRTDIRTGYAFVIPTWSIQVARGLTGRNETNNRAELTAISHALETIHSEITGNSLRAIDAKEIVLYTDSQYALQVMKKWTKSAGVPFRIDSQATSSTTADKWAHLRVVPIATAEFTKCDPKSIDAPNPDCIARLYDAIAPLIDKGVVIHFCKCAAHTGRTDEVSRGNALADELAQQAAECSGVRNKEQLTPIAKSGMSSGVPVILFGKFKGKSADEVGDEYMDWVAREFRNGVAWTKGDRIRENIQELISWKTKQSMK